MIALLLSTNFGKQNPIFSVVVGLICDLFLGFLFSKVFLNFV